MSFPLQQRFAAALEARGETLVKKTARYLVYTRTAALGSPVSGGRAPKGFFYLGKAGSLRAGWTFAESRPVRPDLKAQLLAESPLK